MTDLSRLTTEDLLYLIRQQYRAGIHTCNPCVKCQQMVIGTGHCMHCLGDELRTRLGDHGHLVVEFASHLSASHRALVQANATAEEIIDVLGGGNERASQN